MARVFQGMQLAMAFLVIFFLLGNMALAEDTLFNGESLKTGESLENGPYRFIMQGDCNLVLYVNSNRPLWNSATDRRGNACRATLQNNGNLVVFDNLGQLTPTVFSGNDVVWTSNSARGPNNYRLVVQGDGNVVIYGAALWVTNTVQNNRKLLR